MKAKKIVHSWFSLNQARDNARNRGDRKTLENIREMMRIKRDQEKQKPRKK